jgi:hypothetical protein
LVAAEDYPQPKTKAYPQLPDELRRQTLTLAPPKDFLPKIAAAAELAIGS